MPTTLQTEFSDNPVLDSALVNEAKALMQAKFPQMVSYYIEDTEGYITYIEKALADNNTEGLIPPAHTAKSSSKQMGALRLSAIARTIELEAREAVSLKQSPRQIGLLLEKMKQTFIETREAFRHVA